MNIGNALDATVPTGANTVVLLDTFVQLSGIPLDTHKIERYKFRVDNTQAFTLRLYSSKNGLNYKIFATVAVAIPAGALQISQVDQALIEVPYLKVDVLNGGVDQTTWNVIQGLVEGDRAATT